MDSAQVSARSVRLPRTAKGHYTVKLLVPSPSCCETNAIALAIAFLRRQLHLHLCPRCCVVLSLTFGSCLQHSIMSSPDPSPQQTPQRLSNLYQYHNAPEVAPAAGLEYDDTVYPVSDKYPVIQTAGLHHHASRRKSLLHGSSNRPPLIIFGMKFRTFLAVALVLIIVIIGAAVGGAVGGKNLRENQPVASEVASR